ncbi:MAG TPA: peptidoglycan glycosyltransferase [Epulopiscium sp.]|nr:peptidoglycan glycosyltransferase [Candidatus Epulonipiscium sp.]
MIQKRILIFIAGFLLLAMLLVTRLGYIKIVDGTWLQEGAEILHTRDRLISPIRGTIYDRNQVALAQSASVATIGVVNTQVKEPEKVAKILAEKLELEYDWVYKKVIHRVALERIKSKVSKDVADEIRAMNLAGVKVDEDTKRYYPYKNLLSHVIGFVGKDNQGIIGLEVKYEKYLKGSQGKLLMETDGHGKRRDSLAERRIKPVPGNHLVTTLDVNIQEYVEQALEKIVEVKGAKRGAIILMNPQNGEIYAMANKPDFDLNEPFTINDETIRESWDGYSTKEQNDMLNQMWRNFSINDTYEPGSTFKIFTSAIGIQEGVVSENSPFVCTGSRTVGGRSIKCWRSPRSHGAQTFVEGVQNSCNPVFMEVAERVGAETFYNYMAKFGFSEKTNIDLPGEAVGIMHKLKNIGSVELATMSFGQSFQITPMQLLRGASATLNGGYLVTPHIGDYVIDNEGNVVEKFDYPLGKQVITTDTSDRLKEILESVVEVGTGNKSYIPGYRIGGKTATSEKLPRRSGKYIASFLAFAPAEHPTVVGIVIVDEPQGSYYGGAVTGPVMKEVFENVLPYLGIKPVYNEKELEMEEIEQIKVPDFQRMTIEEAKKYAKECKVSIQIEGSGEHILNQFPHPEESINYGNIILLYTE